MPPVIGEQALVWPALALVLMAVLLGGVVPRILPRFTRLRRSPAVTLLLWQAVSLSAVGSALLAAPVALLAAPMAELGWSSRLNEVGWLMPLLGVSTTVFIAARLLVRGHVVGTALRSARRRHRELVDLIAVPQQESITSGVVDADQVRVLEHPTPTAYCVPGGGRRVVLSQGTLTALAADELAAVLAHERAHLSARHDLILEFFTVWHTAVPAVVRSGAGLAEVQLLIELLADRAAQRQVGALPLARALTALSRSAHPSATLGIENQALIRIEAMSEPGASVLHLGAVLVAISAVAAAPWTIAAWALL